MSLLRPCRDSIDEIYKQLTISSVAPLGGQAWLNLENDSEPFSGGIKYIATPPTKRFREMDQLSGRQGLVLNARLNVRGFLVA